MNMQLPEIYGITATILFAGVDKFLLRLDEILAKSRLKLLQVRENNMESLEFEKFAKSCVNLCHQYNCKVLINADLNLVHRVNADGIHLKSAKLTAAKEEYQDLLVAFSCHNEAELDLCFNKHQADFAVLSPVKRTNSHINTPTLGWDKFQELAKKYQKPIFALGGLKISDLSIAQHHGACGIASMRDIWDIPSNY